MPIAAIINNLAGAGYFPTTYKKGKAYEIWVYLNICKILLQRSKATGSAVSNVVFKNYTGAPLPSLPFVVRGSPGQIHSRHEAPDKPSYVSFQIDDREYELHIGVQFKGRSNALHEFDISVIPQTVGDHFRNLANGSGSPEGHPRVGLELKNHAGNLDVGVPRDFLGAVFDCTYWKQHRIVSPITEFDVLVNTNLRDNNANAALCIFTPMALSQGASDYCSRYAIRRCTGTNIGNTGHLHALVTWIETNL